jgi:hypothetical protein
MLSMTSLRVALPSATLTAGPRRAPATAVTLPSCRGTPAAGAFFLFLFSLRGDWA